MKIAITWVTWFVWGYLAEYFSKQGHEVIWFWRKVFSLDWVRYLKWDIRYPYPHKMTKIDLFIDTASDIDYMKSESVLIDNNVVSLKNIHDLLIRSGCKRYFYISSSSVYQWLHWVLQENLELDPCYLQNSYAISKYLAEQYISQYFQEDIQVSILRPRAIYGTDDKTLLPNIINHSFLWYLFLLWNGKTKTSLTAIENISIAIEKIFIGQTSFREIYNVSDDGEYTYNMIYEKIIEKKWMRWLVRINWFLLSVLSLFQSNKWKYLIDMFEHDKILDISKLKNIWYSSSMNLSTFLDI